MLSFAAFGAYELEFKKCFVFPACGAYRADKTAKMLFNTCCFSRVVNSGERSVRRSCVQVSIR